MSNENLIKKLSKAMDQITAVDKDGKNTYQNYTFQSEGAIKAVVKKALADNGLMIVPSYEIIQQYDRQGAKGKITHFVDVMGTFVITDGENEIVGTMAGSGQDTAEKAMVKAETTSQKYFYKQLFNISDQDEDPDTSDSSNGGRFSQTGTFQNTKNKQAQKELIEAKKKMSMLLGEVALATKKKSAEVQECVAETIQKENPDSKKWSPLEKFQKMISILEKMKKDATGTNSEQIDLVQGDF